MKFFQRLLRKINGLHYPQEYLCLSEESLQKPLHVYLVHQGRVSAELTKSHSFVGYCPLIIAMPSSVLIAPYQRIQLAFSDRPFTINEFLPPKAALASLHLQKIREQPAGGKNVIYYQGIKGAHRFVPPLNQFAIDINNRIYGKKPGNVFLEGNLYKQVQIAYALSRKICLITVGQEERFNLFPTDLHGRVDDHFYLISLRHEGKACEQVLSTQRIVISDMQSSAFRQVYALGKNHMQPLKHRESFQFATYSSLKFGLPLPRELSSYKELELEASFVQGIHRLLLFRTVSEVQLERQPSTLVHVHNAYATWRHKKGLESNYLLR
jgi:hypothetical protein